MKKNTYYVTFKVATVHADSFTEAATLGEQERPEVVSVIEAGK